MHATIRKTDHLAAGDRMLERLIDLTFPGMAHFASTGPGDQCCGGCRHWAGTATRKQAPCGKYLRLTSRSGRDVPRLARACKYFLPSDSA